jgi:hypothetical protein
MQAPDTTPGARRAFDRHAILTAHYREEIGSWDWAAIKAHALANITSENPDEESDDAVGSTYLGSVFALTPSGKFYMPWTSNQTRSDETRDGAWWDALDEIADEHGMWIEQGEGDPCDVFACTMVR